MGVLAAVAILTLGESHHLTGESHQVLARLTNLYKF